MADIEVTATSAKTTYAYAEPIILNVVVVNTFPGEVLLASDHVVATKTSGTSMRAILGQPKPDPDLVVDLYDFKVPHLEAVARGGKWSGDVKVPMPLSEPVEDATGTVQAVEAKLSGQVTLQFDVGYGVSPFQGGSLATLEAFLDWQKVQSAAPITIEIKGP